MTVRACIAKAWFSAHRNLVQPCRDGQRKALETAAKILEQRISDNRDALRMARAKQLQEVSRATSQVSSVESKAVETSNSYTGGFGAGGCIGLSVILLGTYFCFMMMNVGVDAASREFGSLPLPWR